MRLRRLAAAVVTAAAVLLPISWASAAEPLPLAPARQVEMELSSGTWLSLDLSPAGDTLLLDLLGDIYRLPARGGVAQAITGGLPVDTQPVFSPDGQWIAFISDRSGSDNLWIMRPDGADARQLTFSDDETVYVSPAWRADGLAIYVSRFWPSLAQYELLMQPLAGPGTVVAPIRPDRETPRERWQSTLGASASRDGRWLYYARHDGPLGHDDAGVWSIVRRDLATDAESVVVGGLVGRGMPKDSVFRPRISPDGRHLAYAMHRGGRTELRIRNLMDGSDRRLAELDRDQLYAAAWQDLVPSFAFSPDGNGLFVTRRGRIERLSVDGISPVTAVPFRAHASVEAGPSTRVRLRETQGPVRPRLIQAPISSPDNGTLAFSALAAIYVQDLQAGSAVRRISLPGQAAFQPSWSPDGKLIAYVTWDEAEGGFIWTGPADGSAPPTRFSPTPAFYSYPVFTPDGDAIIVARSPAAARQQSSFAVGLLREAELILMPIKGGKPRRLGQGRIGGRPHFTRNGGTVHILTPEGLAGIDVRTGERRIVGQVKGPGWYFQDSSAAADDLRIAPNGKWLLAQIAQQLYLVPVPADGGTIDLEAGNQGARRISGMGADYFEWRRDGRIEWSVGTRFLQATDLPSAADDEARTIVDVDFRVPANVGRGNVVLRGARILTMAPANRLIDDGEIWIADGRIRAVGERGRTGAPDDAVVLDMTGRTIIPGLIDVHDHIGSIRRNVLSLDDWSLRARLAWGVTTSFDPSTLSIDMLAYQDLLDTGRMVGPRLRSTGPALFSFNRFRSLDQVREVLRRYRDAYRIGNIKVYRTGNRRVRQWLAIAAREFGLLPTTEGALALRLDLSQILDGFAGHEHALPAVPLGPDLIGLMKAMRTSYTTTLLTTHGGPPAADWFVARDDPASDAKIQRFWPSSAIDQRLTEHRWISLSKHRFTDVAAGAAALADAGGLVGMGSHGEVPGPGLHWEMEAHVMGGMTPLEALHAATAGSAETIGRLDDLGTLEVGKIADLVVLHEDPREDIRHTRRIAAVMREGRLYDAATLEQLWPDKELPSTMVDRGDRESWLPADPSATRLDP